MHASFVELRHTLSASPLELLVRLLHLPPLLVVHASRALRAARPTSWIFSMKKSACAKASFFLSTSAFQSSKTLPSRRRHLQYLSSRSSASVSGLLVANTSPGPLAPPRKGRGGRGRQGGSASAFRSDHRAAQLQGADLATDPSRAHHGARRLEPKWLPVVFLVGKDHDPFLSMGVFKAPARMPCM